MIVLWERVEKVVTGIDNNNNNEKRLRAIPFLFMGDPRSPKCLTPLHTPYNIFFLHLAPPYIPPTTTFFQHFAVLTPLHNFLALLRQSAVAVMFSGARPFCRVTV